MNRERTGDGAEQMSSRAPTDYETIICERCGKEAIPLHLGCRLCEDCCDCRPGIS